MMKWVRAVIGTLVVWLWALLFMSMVTLSYEYGLDYVHSLMQGGGFGVALGIMLTTTWFVVAVVAGGWMFFALCVFPLFSVQWSERVWQWWNSRV